MKKIGYIIITISAIFTPTSVNVAAIIYYQDFERKVNFIRDFWNDKSDEYVTDKCHFEGKRCWEVYIRNENKDRLKVCRAVEDLKCKLTEKDSFELTFYIKNNKPPSKGSTKYLIGLIGLFKSKVKSPWSANSPFVGISISFDQKSKTPFFSLCVRPRGAPWYDYHYGKKMRGKLGKWYKVSIQYLGTIRKFTFKIFDTQTNKIVFEDWYILPVYGRGYTREFTIDCFGFCDIRATDGRDIGVCIDDIRVIKLNTSAEFEI